MGPPIWLRQSVRIGLDEFTDTIQAIRNNPIRLRLLTFSFFAGGIGVGGIGILYIIALRSTESTVPISSYSRGVVAFLWFGTSYLILRALSFRPNPSRERLSATSVTLRAVVVGRLIGDFFRSWLFLILPTLIFTGVIGAAFFAPITVLLIPLTVCLFVASAIVFGYVVGFARLLLIAHSRYTARNIIDLGVLLFIVTVIIYILIQSSYIGESTISSIGWLPVSWFIDLAVLGTPIEASYQRAIGAVAVALLIIILGGLVAERLAIAYWCRESTNSGSKNYRESE
jgi:hypothetical protein